MEDNPFDKLEKSNEKKSKKSDKNRLSTPAEKESDKPEKTDKSEDKTPLDKLDKEERQLVSQEIIEQRKDDVNHELAAAEPDSPEESESIVGAAFLEILDEKLTSGAEFDDALVSAEQETLTVAGLEEFTTTQEIEEEIVPDSQEIPIESSDELEPDERKAIAFGGGSSGVPPATNRPSSAGSSLSGGGNTAAVYAGAPRPNHNQQTSQSVGNTGGNKHMARRAFFAGGVLGYLIGRRRGRIKTEAKLLPIQQSLEKEVHVLQKAILEREQKIRRLTATAVGNDPEAPKKLLNRVHELQEFKYPERNKESSEVSARVATKLESVGTLAIIAGEIKQQASVKPVEQMLLSEILVVAEKITIENSNLKVLFAAGHVNETGLRRIVKEYARGGQYDTILRKELRSPGVLTDTSSPNVVASAINSVNQESQSKTATPQNQAISQIIGNSSRFKTMSIGRKENSKSPFIITLLVVVAVMLFVVVR